MESQNLNKIGLKAVAYFDDNIERKVDDKGKPFKPYSFDYWLRKKYKKKSTAKRGSKARQKFIEQAYSKYETEKDKVTLSDTSNMRSAQTVTKVDPQNNKVTIGYENEEAAEEAWYHNVTGAGKSRIRRRFMYLTEKQKESLTEFARDLMVKDKDFARDLVNMLSKIT